jgi:preprotein translocase subunit SecD
VLLLVVSAFVSYPLLASRYGWPEPGWIANHRLRLGLDLKGGVHVVLQVQPDPSAPREPGVDDATWRRQTIERVRDTIDRRVDALGIGEATIAVQGSQHDRLLIQLPGFTDMARARALLQSPGVLTIRLLAEAAEAESEAPPAGEVVVRGADVRGARVTSDEWGRPAVGFTLSPEAGRRFGDVTGRNIGRSLAIQIDDRVVSVARIEDRITDDGQISGVFSPQQAADLAAVLRSGTLPARIIFLQQGLVGATLGADSIRAGITASLAGLALVVTFMLVYYRWSGVNAVLALGFNLALVLGIMSWLGAVMTLPGIAGFILTMGMGVDSNVLIFERIREERAAGRTARAAIDAGFKRVFATLLDTHIAALISAAFLFQFGTSPIRGFAVTLSVGLIMNLFTSIVVSRTLFQLVSASRPARVR